jgi:hypothetical protein
MKLMTEITEEVKLITEEKDGEGKQYFIEGVFMQGDIQNRNGRIYPIGILEKEVTRYVTENIEKKRAYGELGHPAGPTINLERVSHLITSLKKEGSNYVGRAKIMDTPYGNIVKNLMKEGAQLGASSRGLGSLKPNKLGIMEVQSDFTLATAADIVADPSAPEAYVRGVMEDVEWIFDVSRNSWIAKQVIEQTKLVGIKSNRELQERKVEFFERFLTSLK